MWVERVPRRCFSLCKSSKSSGGERRLLGCSAGSRTSHNSLVSQHARKRLRSRTSDMLNGRTAAGVHQPPLACKWRNNGSWRRGFPMAGHPADADVRLPRRLCMRSLQLCGTLPHPMEAWRKLSSYLLQRKHFVICRSLTHWDQSSSYINQVLLKWASYQLLIFAAG